MEPSPWVPPVWVAVWEHDHNGNWRFSLRPDGSDDELYSASTNMPATDQRAPGTTLLRYLGLVSVPGSQWEWDCPRSRWTRHVLPVTPAAERTVLNGKAQQKPAAGENPTQELP